VASLRELQMSFAAALRDSAAPCAVQPTANLSIYRNNSAIAFRAALEQTFPVLKRRVGEDYFRQLCFQYRQQHPSRSGDLHWAGREFDAFLANHLADTEYAWLAHLARLEWACAQAAVAAVLPAAGVGLLGDFAPAQLEQLHFKLQPSLALQAATFPVFSIWLANQSDNASPVDQSLGFEQGMVRARADGVQVQPLDSSTFAFLGALAAGSPLGEAVTAANLDQPGLLNALRFVFERNLECAVTLV
jgi:hypothetical protein